jgi:ABC-2 type transport system ATP-binding protein
MPAPAISISGLTKYYGRVVGVDGLSLDVQPGEIFGFLGANGAGKTTTIRLLLDLLRPTSGHASVMGFDCQRQGLDARRRIGYLPAEMPMYPELTGAAYLTYLSSLGPPPSAATMEALFRRFDVSDLDLRRRMRDYSHGMKRKLGLIQALMGDPPVLILDEPTAGLDPLMIDAFAETIEALARSGRTTVMLSSHVLSEIDRVCSRIALIRAGRLVAVHTLSELRAVTPRRVIVTFAGPVAGPGTGTTAWTVVSREPMQWVIDARGPIGDLVASLSGLPVADIRLAPFAMEDALLHLFAGSDPGLTPPAC